MKKLSILLLVVCLACSESKEPSPEKEPSPGPDPLPALDQNGKALVQVEQLTNELEYISRLALAGAPSLFAPCSDVSVGTDGPFTIYTFEFDNTACVDGKIRSGDLQIAVNPETLDVIIQSLGLFIDGVKVEGVYTIQPLTENGVEYTKLLSTGAKISAANGDWFSFTTTKRFQWKEGKNTSSETDDVLEVVSGEYFLTMKNGSLCQLDIDAPLQISYECNERNFLPVSGLVTLESLQEITRVNFGNGQCTGVPTQSK